jgi:hypothetical protein
MDKKGGRFVNQIAWLPKYPNRRAILIIQRHVNAPAVWAGITHPHKNRTHNNHPAPAVFAYCSWCTDGKIGNNRPEFPTLLENRKMGK